jgi:hypothetical protein
MSRDFNSAIITVKTPTSSEQRLRVAKMYAEPEWPTEKILDEIKTKASWGKEWPGFILQPFSALLVRLSRDAELTAASVNRKTQSLIVLTRILVVMTGILIILTIPLVIIESRKFVAEVFQTPLHLPQDKNNARHDNQQPNATNKSDDRNPVGPTGGGSGVGVGPIAKPTTGPN